MPSRNKIHGLMRIAAAGLISLSALLGCASGPKTFEIKASADPVINRDANGRALSVVVHVYQLKEAGEFSKLTFDMLASGRTLSDMLSKDLLEMSEVMLVPGGTYTGSDKVHQDARHIGVVAFFRQPDQHYWRMLVDADQVRDRGLDFRVQDCFLSLNAPGPTLIPGQPASPPTSCTGSDFQAGSTTAGSAASQPRQGAIAKSSKRNDALDIGRQVIESLLTKKP